MSENERIETALWMTENGQQDLFNGLAEETMDRFVGLDITKRETLLVHEAINAALMSYFNWNRLQRVQPCKEAIGTGTPVRGY